MTFPCATDAGYVGTSRSQAGSHQGDQVKKEFSVYVGLDVYEDTIAVAIAAARGVPQYHDGIANTRLAIKRLMHKLSPVSGMFITIQS